MPSHDAIDEPPGDRRRDRVTIMVVDDHPMWRETVRKVLEVAGAGVVVAEAATGEEAVDLSARWRPDVVIMDVNLPGIDGIEATSKLVAQTPGTKVLALSSSDEPQHVVEIIRAGASGYLLKTASGDELTDAVGRIHLGEAVLPPTLADIVLGELRRQGAADDGARPLAQDDGSPVGRLTPREREVLGLMAEGRSNRAIGERLFIGHKSVEASVRSIYMKLGLEPVPDDHRRVLAVLTFLG